MKITHSQGRARDVMDTYTFPKPKIRRIATPQPLD